MKSRCLVRSCQEHSSLRPAAFKPSSDFWPSGFLRTRQCILNGELSFTLETPYPKPSTLSIETTAEGSAGSEGSEALRVSGGSNRAFGRFLLSEMQAYGL